MKIAHEKPDLLVESTPNDLTLILYSNDSQVSSL